MMSPVHPRAANLRRFRFSTSLRSSYFQDWFPLASLLYGQSTTRRGIAFALSYFVPSLSGTAPFLL